MIIYEKPKQPQSIPNEAGNNRFDEIRKAALEQHKKSDTDGTRRRARQKAEDNKLI